MEKRLIRFVLVMLFCLCFSGTAGAVTFSPSSANLDNLDHDYYYTWGIDWTVPADQTIISATLEFDNIYNWDNQPNDLYVHLLDSANLGVSQGKDWGGWGDYFSGQGTLLEHWVNLSSTAQDISYSFSNDEIAALVLYSQDGNFGLGFDPDCHFYNSGVSLTIETSAVPIPAAVYLFGTGLLGIIGIRRKKS